MRETHDGVNSGETERQETELLAHLHPAVEPAGEALVLGAVDDLHDAGQSAGEEAEGKQRDGRRADDLVHGLEREPLPVASPLDLEAPQTEQKPDEEDDAGDDEWRRPVRHQLLLHRLQRGRLGETAELDGGEADGAGQVADLAAGRLVVSGHVHIADAGRVVELDGVGRERVERLHDGGVGERLRDRLGIRLSLALSFLD